MFSVYFIVKSEEVRKVLNYSKNRVPFSEICSNAYGRKVIFSNVEFITIDNIVEELGKALSVHWNNRREIDYLERYYKGDQPILYRTKMDFLVRSNVFFFEYSGYGKPSILKC